jgi:tetratricopeptide (TPR) repeat protein/predicted Ser/Thr protein kinase
VGCVAEDGDRAAARPGRREPTAPHDASGVLPAAASGIQSIVDGRREQIGRYVVLKALGEGGMGVVLAAYDADLDRKVALKILRDDIRDGSVGAVRMRREAQAMARLSHPNVAQVYEVAEDQHGRLFLAMEYIEGVTLRVWLDAQPRSWREVLAVYIAAGRGLAAAHAAGLMHRDFKPDNAMLARDGRVRVVDFGLSRRYSSHPDDPSSSSSGQVVELTVTRAGTLMGTPAYMAPEQLEREEVDARSDQFSFCVSLWEALYRRRPYLGDTMVEVLASMRHEELVNTSGSKVPAWLRRVLARGLAVEPSLRWPTMDALLAALERDPERARRRWLAAAAGVVAIAGASYGVAAYRIAEAQVCSGAAEELAEVWGAEQRARIVDALQWTGVAYAERAATTVVNTLDNQAAQWMAVHTSSCTSHQRGHMSPQLFDRRMACLRQRRSELAATAAVLAQTTRDTAAQAVDTARGLPAIALCEDDERLLAAVAPPEDPQVSAAVEEVRGRLARLQALERGGRHAEALASVMPMTAEAEHLGFVPLRAEVHLLAGKLLMYHSRPEARTYLEQTLEWSLAADASEIAAEALAVTVFDLASVEHRPHDALVLLPAARGLMRRIDDPPQLVALLHNNAANAWHLIGDPRRAIAAYEEGLALLEAHAPEDPLRWGIVNNLGLGLNSVGEFERAAASVRAALPALEQQFDPCYVLAAILRSTLGVSDAGAGRISEGTAELEAGIACLGPEFSAYEVNLRGELARLYLLQGDDVRAQEQVTRAEQRITENPDVRPEGLRIALVRIDLEIDRGDLAAARASITRLLAPASDGTPVESHWRTAAEIRRCLIAHLEDDHAAAREHLRRAEELLGPDVEHDERGLFAFTRARVLRALGADPLVIAKATDDALTAYTAAGAPYAGKLAEIRAWQANPDTAPSAP